MGLKSQSGKKWAKQRNKKKNIAKTIGEKKVVKFFVLLKKEKNNHKKIYHNFYKNQQSKEEKKIVAFGRKTKSYYSINISIVKYR